MGKSWRQLGSHRSTNQPRSQPSWYVTDRIFFSLKLFPNLSLIAYIESLTEPTLDTQYNNTAGANPDRRLYEYKSYCHEKTQTHIQIFFHLENIIRVRTLFEAKNQMSFKIFTLLKRVKSRIQSKAKKKPYVSYIC